MLALIWHLALLALAPPAPLPAAPTASNLGARRSPVVEAVQRTGPAVVSVFSEQKVERNPFGIAPGEIPDLEELFGRRPRQGGTSLGSGVMIDGARGIVLTNAHVVANAA